jgi:hypothetical protein
MERPMNWAFPGIGFVVFAGFPGVLVRVAPASTRTPGAPSIAPNPSVVLEPAGPPERA